MIFVGPEVLVCVGGDLSHKAYVLVVRLEVEPLAKRRYVVLGLVVACAGAAVNIVMRGSGVLWCANAHAIATSTAAIASRIAVVANTRRGVSDSFLLHLTLHMFIVYFHQGLLRDHIPLCIGLIACFRVRFFFVFLDKRISIKYDQVQVHSNLDLQSLGGETI